MSEHTPDRWVIVRITSKEHPQIDKVVGSWFGGYGGSDSWRMNSGIERIEEHEKHYDIHGYSGSVYKCYKESQGWSMYTHSVIENMAKQLEESGRGIMKVIGIQEILNDSK
jgi:hypothetical protein